MLKHAHHVYTRGSCAPAVLILEDLHKVFPAQADDAPSPPLADAAADMLAALAHNADRPPVLVLATAIAADQLHPALRVPGLLDCEHRLSMPECTARRRIVLSLVRHLRVKCSKPVVDWVAASTEGFVAAELLQLVESARLTAAARQLLPVQTDAMHVRLRKSDMEDALQHVTSTTHVGGAVNVGTMAGAWDNVGGLETIKHVLMDLVVMPLRLPRLFAAAPLRLASGALLYGHAGCGMTLLASALAAEAGLPFLTVKGPELLNKFIGASEAAVRDLFARAKSCQPCIVFFDEFEAIAPRRGQDSTGVTDRVVNQLLCELDGVESLRGVFVLAASNRPELIDPALLRPGRLDRKLLCPLPDRDARASILRVLLSKVQCDSSLQGSEALDALVARCDGYSGADMQGLVATAQLSAVHEVIDSGHGDERQRGEGQHLSQQSALSLRGQPWLHLDREWWRQLDSGSQPADDGAEPAVRVFVAWRHLEQAVLVSQPSISPAHRQERDATFRAFGSGTLETPSAQSVVHA